MLLYSASVLKSDSKVRTIRVCYEDRIKDESLFSLQLEVWSRSSDKNMWLSVIGHDKIIFEGSYDCDDLSPAKDYVLTELLIDAHKSLGIT